MKASSILGRVVAVMSGSVLLVLLLFVPMPAVVAVSVAGSVWDPSQFAVSIKLLYIPCFLLGIASGALPAIALARFTLRVLPLNASGALRSKCAIWLRRSAYFLLLLFAVELVGVILMPVPNEDLRYTPFVVTLLSAWATTLTGGMALSSWAHHHPNYFRTRPFILYLRRFSSFADRTIVAEILKAAPRRVPVIFIASPGDQAANWDPFVWSFSGIRLTDPLAAIPIQLRTPDSQWEKSITKLISEAAFVVADVTDLSNSVEAEVRLVTENSQPGNVLWLMQSGQSGIGRRPTLSASVGHVLEYRRRWAIWTIVAKLAAFGFVAYEICFILEITYWNNQVTFASLATVIVSVLATVLLGAMVAFRPSIDRDARAELRRILRGGPASVI